MKNNLTAIKKHIKNNEIEILGSQKAGCFFCGHEYSARKINDWANSRKGMSAICPVCGVASVIGDASGLPTDSAFLKETGKQLFLSFSKGEHKRIIEKFIERLEENDVEWNKDTESCYIDYIKDLANSGDVDSTLTLAKHYAYGSKWQEPDYEKVIEILSFPSLSNNEEALNLRGFAYFKRNHGDQDLVMAYRCFSEAIALGNSEAVINFADLNEERNLAPDNPRLSYSILFSFFNESLSNFVISRGLDCEVFHEICYRLGKRFFDGLEKDHEFGDALIYLLLARCGFHYLRSSRRLNLLEENESEMTDKMIDIIAKKLGYKAGRPVFDNDTFADSDCIKCDFNSAGILNKKEFSNYSLNKEEKIFSFDLSSSLPSLIIDSTNLFCDFINGTIHWEFVDVDFVQIGDTNQIDFVSGDPSKGYSFFHLDAAGKHLVCDIVFALPKKPVAKTGNRKKKKA